MNPLSDGEPLEHDECVGEQDEGADANVGPGQEGAITNGRHRVTVLIVTGKVVIRSVLFTDNF